MSKSEAFFNPDQYATVAERIELFYSRFPEGRINTELVARADGEITFRAFVYRSAAETLAAATGWACEKEGDGDVNTVACLENTETSAVGRALANLGFTASTRRPSREEMEKVARVRLALLSREDRQSEAVPLHSQSDLSADLFVLLSTAQGRGFPLRRSEVLRRGIRQPGMSAGRLSRIERSLRSWVRRHEL